MRTSPPSAAAAPSRTTTTSTTTSGKTTTTTTSITTSGKTTTTTTAAATTTTTPTTAQGSSTLATTTPVAGPVACTAANLALSYLGQQGATGHGEIGIALYNITGSSCYTFGYPGAQFLDRAGQPLPTDSTRTTQDFFGNAPEEALVVGSGQSQKDLTRRSRKKKKKKNNGDRCRNHRSSSPVRSRRSNA